jgi:alkylation response protein AidB-like acyl-CoA dehydrogenase
VAVDLALSEQQDALIAEFRESFARELRPAITSWEEAGEVPAEAVRTLASLGCMSLTYPPALGGRGLGWLDHGLILEELARAGSGLGVIVHLQNTYPKLAGEGVQRAVVAGRALVAFADREAQTYGPVSGTLTTTATPTGDGYVLHGRKTNVLLVPGATHIIVTALTDPAGGYFDGMSLFLVEADAPGVTVDPVPLKGLRLVHLGNVALEGVRVPTAGRLGAENNGYQQLRRLWAPVRGVRLFWDIASALEAIHFMVEDTKKKKTFGKPLLKWQAIQFKLSDAQTNLELLRSMVQYLAWALDEGLTVTDPGVTPDAYASMLYLLFTDFGVRAFEDVLELGSGRAFREDHPIWQRYMDHLTLRLLDGGAELDRRIVGAEAFGPDWAYAALPPNGAARIPAAAGRRE